MKPYIGIKTAKARPMTRGEYNEYRGWEVPADENPEDEGYLIEEVVGEGPSNQNHPDHAGYIRWEPKALFESTYQNSEGNQKTLHNSDISEARQNVKDIQVVGNGDMFRLLCKASSKNEGWMKSCKAMEIDGVGCVVQVTTQQGNNVAEALTFVPGVKIVDDVNNGRKLVPNQ